MFNVDLFFAVLTALMGQLVRGFSSCLSCVAGCGERYLLYEWPVDW